MGQETAKPRAIIVKFGRISHRNMVYMNKRKLKHTKIVIIEDLIRSRYETLLLAKQKIEKEKVWTMEGVIYTKVNGKKITLKSEDDVEKIII
ncbi:hypothetical protein JTB14_019203 [Gonioctena quinquepunctata]|nr:hypothetical protein JTB14_019203 [Gonioctena quinquepunctata]